jgi:hypothetical protein
MHIKLQFGQYDFMKFVHAMFGITVSMSESRRHTDFSKVTCCSFCKITIDYRNSDILIMIPNIHLVFWSYANIHDLETMNMAIFSWNHI